jgi:hypothetical protein
MAKSSSMLNTSLDAERRFRNAEIFLRYAVRGLPK